VYPSAQRAAGLERLAAFIPSADRYAARRNQVEPGHENVSGLSPYLRRRLITEREVLGAVLARHPFARVNKFVQEVCWRSYWKGWLQLRPAVWDDYLERAAGDRDALDSGVAERLAAAEAGRTGLICLDDWARELVATGYLHNHARMWFASIWIFTLGLPWSLGAAFFLRHLLDGDPASNTLSWRWVAGLHTRGKHYLARAENIERYTGGRYAPYGELNEDAPALVESRTYARRSLRPAERLDPDLATALLITTEDLAPEHSAAADLVPCAIAGGWSRATAEAVDLAEPVCRFEQDAAEDALRRAGAHYGRAPLCLPADDWLRAALDWAQASGARQVATLTAPVGPWRPLLDELGGRLQARSLRLVELRRGWDGSLWPHATHGYFRFREHIPEAVAPLAEATRVGA
jgi:deoxyribodipyrimidine photo-lyase